MEPVPQSSIAWAAGKRRRGEGLLVDPNRVTIAARLGLVPRSGD